MGSFELQHWIVAGIVAWFLWRYIIPVPGRAAADEAKRIAKAATPAFAWPERGEYEAEVVGESHYQRALAGIAGEHGEDAAEVKTTAVLVPEDKNPHDNKAVRVEIDGWAVGYLSRDDARTYRRRLSTKKLGMVPASCGAAVMGGFVGRDGKRASYGVLLDIKPFD